MVLALVWPRSLTQVYRLWMTVGEVLGWINTRIILGVLFYLLFTPMGLLHAAARQGPHAAHLGTRGGELSCRAPATALFPHAASVLSARKQVYG